jgi:predicted O-methyltransferase YrrM
MNFIKYLTESAFHEYARPAENTNKKIQGWMCSKFASVFEQIVTAFNKPIIIIEVGTWKGLSACTMADITKHHNIDARIVCVDTWLGAPEFWTWGLKDPTRGGSLNFKHGYPQVYYTFLDNVVGKGHSDVISPLPLSSNEAVNVLAYHNVVPDVIYVDASHEYDAVKNDIRQYWKLLKVGGTMIGDDYCPQWEGVKRAVNERVVELNEKLSIDGVVWKITKTH